MGLNRYYMFHKPAGCVTAKTDDTHKTVMDYFYESDKVKLHPVGRLDKDTEGLLFVTDDGKWNQKLMHPDEHVDKTYYFSAMGELTEEKRKRLCNGIELEEGYITKPAKIDNLTLTTLESLYPWMKQMSEQLHDKKYKKLLRNPVTTPVTNGYITISEGKKHQVKRMLKASGCYVVYLKRIAIGQVKLDCDLQAGEYRSLTTEELKALEGSEYGWNDSSY